MSVIEAILWGILQGATEFLPVSSSGHLVLVPWLLGRDPTSFTFDVLVHFATLFAVLIYFRHDLVILWHGIMDILKGHFQTQSARLTWLIAIASVPAVVVALLLRDLFERLFATPPAAALLLLVTGALLFMAERFLIEQRELGSLGVRDAITIGLAQSLALAPGISRSGATISTGLFRGFDRPAAARFSFLMAIPVILGATGLELIDLLSSGLSEVSWASLGAGFVAALLSGYLAIFLLFWLLRERGLVPFAYYCWGMGLFSLLVFILR